MAKWRDIYQTETNLLQYGKQREERLKKKIEEKENKEIEKLSFRPKLTSNKGMYAQYMNPDPKRNVHRKLYNEASQRKKLQEAKQSQLEYTFSPQLATSATECQLQRPKSTKKLINHLYKWKDDLAKKIEEKRHEKAHYEISFDESTGQKMFNPVTNTTDATKNRRKDIFKYLYSLHSSRSKSRKKARDAADKENKWEADKTTDNNVGTF